MDIELFIEVGMKRFSTVICSFGLRRFLCPNSWWKMCICNVCIQYVICKLFTSGVLRCFAKEILYKTILNLVWFQEWQPEQVCEPFTNVTFSITILTTQSQVAAYTERKTINYDAFFPLCWCPFLLRLSRPCSRQYFTMFGEYS